MYALTSEPYMLTLVYICRDATSNCRKRICGPSNCVMSIRGKIYLPKIVFAEKFICRNIYLPKNLFAENCIRQKNMPKIQSTIFRETTSSSICCAIICHLQQIVAVRMSPPNVAFYNIEPP
jgi:hypothetical protein